MAENWEVYADWNPWHGCTKISPGCKYCYVYRQDEMYGSEISSSECRKTGNFYLPIKHKSIIASPLLPLPKWLVNPLRYYQSWNVWTCYHWTGFWKRVFHSHYFDVLLDECRKVWPYGKGKAVREGYKDVYTHKLESIHGADIHFWYGTKEAFVAKPQVEHLLKLCSGVHIEVFPKMNHGQLLVDHPEEVARRIRIYLNTYR